MVLLSLRPDALDVADQKLQPILRVEPKGPEDQFIDVVTKPFKLRNR